jgi:hypothetical protein
MAGPLTALLLADQGAEVIHVDPPGGPFWKTVANATLQRGKQNIVLDLKSTPDLASARGLIGSADVVIENSMTIVPAYWEPLAWGWGYYIVSGRARDSASKRRSATPRRSCKCRICRSARARSGTSPVGQRRKAGGHSNACIVLPTPSSFWEPRRHSSSASPPSLACRQCRVS